MEKDHYLAGEPVFCDFLLQNTGSKTIQFSYRFPRRAATGDLEQEPRFLITDERGRAVADPAPRPCGGAKGSVLYGWATLPPGQTHTERWLLNEWGRFILPGRYRVRAERRLGVTVVDPVTNQPTPAPAGYPWAVNEFAFTIQSATEGQLRAAFQPYTEMLDRKDEAGLPDAVLVVTALPQPFLLPRLQRMATTSAREASWDRRQVLAGLARLGSPAAWDTILKIAQGTREGERQGPPPAAPEDLALRSHAVMLLGQKGDKTTLLALLGMVASAPPELRGDVLQTLGLFDDPRASQMLFRRLHAPQTLDRVNAILGLRNRGSKDVVPALISMLNDPAAQVRQVAHFALQGLTGQRITLSGRASPAESARVAARWHTWWREHGSKFVPVREPPCRDW
jgi:hypothetical protein